MAVQMAFMGLTGLALAGCAGQNGDLERAAAADAASARSSAVFVHCVFFDLKPDTSEAQIDNLVNDAYRLLARVPSVRLIQSGRRDARMQRDVNDAAFTVGLVVWFDDKAGHDLYADHELHKQYIDLHKDRWAKVRVFDFTARRGDMPQSRPAS